MFIHPADRTAVRSAINPASERQRIAALLATLPAHERADFSTLWPRLVHQLARRGELAAPAFDRAP